MRLNSITFAVVLPALAAAAPVPDAQFASGVNVVEVYATVTDDRSQPIQGLSREDFEVRENGELQTITNFAEGDFPLTVVLAIDRSFSMAGERLAVAKSAARIFLGELRPEDQSAILAVGSNVETVSALSSDRTSQYAALAAIDAFGTTGLYDAIIRAIELTQPGKGRRALVVLSDGTDRYSNATAAEVLDIARRSDVIVYPVALGATRPPLFAELASLTGGRSVHVSDTRQLPDTLRAIARELRHQYLLGYSPSKPVIPGVSEWRSIDVRVKRAGAHVRARDGYLVK